MVIPTFWMVKLNRNQKNHYILAFHWLFWAFEKERWQKSAFSGFFLTGEICFAKNTLFGPKNGSIFPVTCKTSSEIHQKIKIFEKKIFGRFCENFENRQF